MKAALYRPSPVLTSHLELMGEAELYPVYEPKPGVPDARFRLVPAGYILDHPDAWRLVRQGTAKAADDECEKRAGMTPAEKVRRYERQIALEAGKLSGDPKLDVPIKNS
jgi:hypothetical protein